MTWQCTECGKNLPTKLGRDMHVRNAHGRMAYVRLKEQTTDQRSLRCYED